MAQQTIMTTERRGGSKPETRRALAEGVGYGIIAGFLFAVLEVIASAAMGQPALAPIRMFASILLGQAALTQTSLGVALVVGLIVHFVLSAGFGVIYGALETRLSHDSRTNFGLQAGAGALYGVALWLVNFQVLGRLFYPWFLAAPQFLQLLFHAVFFGLPLGLMFASAERHQRQMGAPTRTTVKA